MWHQIAVQRKGIIGLYKKGCPTTPNNIKKTFKRGGESVYCMWPLSKHVKHT